MRHAGPYSDREWHWSAAQSCQNGLNVVAGGSKKRILVIDDDPDLRDALTIILEQAGFRVSVAADGPAGLLDFYRFRPDLVVLDVGLTQMDGWQVLERIRDMASTPVLMLTARSGEADKVRGLLSGADDYLTKPFGHQEIQARVHALLRRAESPAASVADVFDDGLIRIDYSSPEILLRGRVLELTPIEHRLLAVLVRNAGQTLSAEQLAERVWDDRSGAGQERVKYGIMRLRRQLRLPDTEPSPIETVRGFGYRYRNPSG